MLHYLNWVPPLFQFSSSLFQLSARKFNWVPYYSIFQLSALLFKYFNWVPHYFNWVPLSSIECPIIQIFQLSALLFKYFNWVPHYFNWVPLSSIECPIIQIFQLSAPLFQLSALISTECPLVQLSDLLFKYFNWVPHYFNIDSNCWRWRWSDKLTALTHALRY